MVELLGKKTRVVNLNGGRRSRFRRRRQRRSRSSRTSRYRPSLNGILSPMFSPRDGDGRQSQPPSFMGDMSDTFGNIIRDKAQNELTSYIDNTLTDTLGDTFGGTLGEGIASEGAGLVGEEGASAIGELLMMCL